LGKFYFGVKKAKLGQVVEFHDPGDPPRKKSPQKFYLKPNGVGSLFHWMLVIFV